MRSIPATNNRVLVAIAPLLVVLQLLAAFAIAFARAQNLVDHPERKYPKILEREEHHSIDDTDSTTNNDVDDSGASIAKSCISSFHCWRAEPVAEDGMPVQLMHRLTKRILIGDLVDGLSNGSRGGKCRCKNGICIFYWLAQKSFLPCQEF